jgi:hypothetical protein
MQWQSSNIMSVSSVTSQKKKQGKTDRLYCIIIIIITTTTATTINCSSLGTNYQWP